MWINGRELPQLETQLPEVTVMDFGFAGIPGETKIKERVKILNGQHDPLVIRRRQIMSKTLFNSQ
jgi:hypothetical protein